MAFVYLTPDAPWGNTKQRSVCGRITWRRTSCTLIQRHASTPPSSVPVPCHLCAHPVPLAWQRLHNIAHTPGTFTPMHRAAPWVLPHPRLDLIAAGVLDTDAIKAPKRLQAQ